MKILLSSITHLAECGYITLQVPEWNVVVASSPPFGAFVAPANAGPEAIDAPDDWFWRCVVVRGKNVPAVGREDGFLFLSPAGWAANKDAIRAAWKPTDRGNGVPTWADFEAHAAEFFAEVRAGAKRRLADEKAKHAKRLAQLEAALEAIE